jgi:hypothetical protein
MMLAAALMLALLPVPATPPPAANPPALVRLPVGTPIRFTTNGPIDSRSIRQGERFGLTVADDVMAGGQLVMPRGTPAVGEVEALSDRGSFGRGAKFTLVPLFVDFGGQRINLTGAAKTEGRSQVGAAAVTTVLIGGVGLLITGRSATLPAGSELRGEVRSEVSLPAIQR